MKNLVWIACNYAKPDLPDDAKVSILRSRADGHLFATCPFRVDELDWSRIICYAPEPKDPVRELVDAAKEVGAYYQWPRLHAAIKAVEDTL
jgi:hypothetical protein